VFLFSIEGGDGSGKGLATKIVSEVLESEFSFSSVEQTGEPRRGHALGKLAIDSVRKKSMTPEQEAGLFAADRLDHSHGWILPRLIEGRAVVSERNIHSSLVYQGIVGGIGVEKAAHMNSAALIPDLCIWVDCDPEIALRRIRNETLRALSNKEEYFETTDFQIKIRQGYSDLLSGSIEMPTPFDMGAILGPIKNEGSPDKLRSILKEAIRSFMHARPNPINVDLEQVDQFQIKSLVSRSEGQKTLSGLGISPAKRRKDWLEDNTPWKVLKSAMDDHNRTLSSEEFNQERLDEMPKNLLNHSISSVCGTLSLIHSADISELRSAMGPVRGVSMRHTQRIVSFLKDSGWILQRKTLIGREAPKSQLRDSYFPYGRLVLAIWPIRGAIMKWHRENPKTHLRFLMGQIVKSGQYDAALSQSLSRISILGSGSSDKDPPKDLKSLVDWWMGK
tara:strand:+ start:2236 stop:3579 length:1344 start_codon:yes stop_codon:yes gene_type:complete